MPTNLLIGKGRTAKFTAMASGIRTNGSNFIYQWRKRDSNDTLSEASEAELIIPNVTESDEGQYYCIVTNEWGRSVETETVSLAVFGMYIICSYICNTDESKFLKVFYVKHCKYYSNGLVNI